MEEVAEEKGRKDGWCQHLLRPGTMDQIRGDCSDQNPQTVGGGHQDAEMTADTDADAAAAAQAAAEKAKKELARKKAHAKYMKFYRSLESRGPNLSAAKQWTCAGI